MKISKKAEYALRAMLAMSRYKTGTVFSIHTLAQDENIPFKFLEQILLVLRRGGILHSRRGAGGGYQMARPPALISVGEIVLLVDGPLSLLSPDYSQARAIKDSFQELEEMIRSWMEKTTLSDLLIKDMEPDNISFEI